MINFGYHLFLVLGQNFNRCFIIAHHFFGSISFMTHLDIFGYLVETTLGTVFDVLAPRFLIAFPWFALDSLCSFPLLVGGIELGTHFVSFWVQFWKCFRDIKANKTLSRMDADICFETRRFWGGLIAKNFLRLVARKVHDPLLRLGKPPPSPHSVAQPWLNRPPDNLKSLLRLSLSLPLSFSFLFSPLLSVSSPSSPLHLS